jgi:hypothetical protein
MAGQEGRERDLAQAARALKLALARGRYCMGPLALRTGESPPPCLGRALQLQVGRAELLPAGLVAAAPSPPAAADAAALSFMCRRRRR